jgi:hypothetical protein
MSAAVVEIDTDECDACPWDAHVHAFLYAMHASWASSLAFCAHHGTIYLPKLAADDAVVVDMRHMVSP